MYKLLLLATAALVGQASAELVLVEALNNTIPGLAADTALAYDACGASPAGAAGALVPRVLGRRSLYLEADGSFVANVTVRERPQLAALRALSAADLEPALLAAGDEWSLVAPAGSACGPGPQEAPSAAQTYSVCFLPAGGLEWLSLGEAEVAAAPTTTQTVAFPGGSVVLEGALAGDWVWPSGASEPSQCAADGVWTVPLALNGTAWLSFAAADATGTYVALNVTLTVVDAELAPTLALAGSASPLTLSGVDAARYETGLVSSGAPCAAGATDATPTAAGSYDLCLSLAGMDDWTRLSSALTVVEPDAPSPLVVTAGTDATFATTVDGVVVALALESDCSGNHSTTVPQDTDEAFLCAALADGVFVNAGAVTVVEPPTFSPARVFAGEVGFSITDSASGTSFVAWVHSTSGVCDDDAIALDNEDATAVQTATYVKIDAGTEAFKLHATPAAGEWQLCYRADWDGQWAAVPGALLTVDEAPVLLGSPAASLGAEQEVQFRGGREGDYAAFVSGGDGCYGASYADRTAAAIADSETTETTVEANETTTVVTTVTTTTWYYPPAWLAAFSADGTATVPSTFMDVSGAYSICVATAESLADEEDDFIEAGGLSATTAGVFYPRHTFVGAPRVMATGFSAGDVLVFTSDADCQNVHAGTPLQANSTAAAAVDDPAHFEAALPADAEPGSTWVLCVQEDGSTFRAYGNDRLTLDALPSLTNDSLQLLAGCASPLGFDGEAAADVVARVNGSESTTDGLLTVAFEGVFQVFVAVADAPEDFVATGWSVEVLAAPEVGPARLVHLSDLWSSDFELGFGAPGANMTAHGEYQVFAKPPLGQWAEVPSAVVTYTAQPEFFPLTVVAGASVELWFSGSAQPGDVVSGYTLGEDLVAVLDPIEADTELVWEGHPLDVLLRAAVRPADVASEHVFAGTTATLALGTYDSADDEVFYTATGACDKPATELASPTTAENHETVQPGTLQLCYRPHGDGVWTLVPEVAVTVIGELQWGPFEVGASTSTPVSFWTASVDVAFDMWVLIRTRGCDAYRVYLGYHSSNSTIDLDVSGVAPGDNVLVAYVSATRTSGSWLRAGFLSVAASLELSASTAYAGVETPIAVSGLGEEDAIGWTTSDCDTREEFVDVLPASLAAGTTLQLCHRLGAAGRPWAVVNGLTVEVLEQPAIVPTTVFASYAADVDFSVAGAVIKTQDRCAPDVVVDPVDIADFALYLGDARLTATISVIEPPTVEYHHLYTSVTTTTTTTESWVAWSLSGECGGADMSSAANATGTWSMCAKPLAGGVWTAITSETVVIEDLPEVDAAAPVFDSGSWALPVTGLRDDDVVALALTADSCDDAVVVDNRTLTSLADFGQDELFVCVAADGGLAPWAQLAESIALHAAGELQYSYEDPDCLRSTLLMSPAPLAEAAGSWAACAGTGLPVPSAFAAVLASNATVTNDTDAEGHEVTLGPWPAHFPVLISDAPTLLGVEPGDWLAVSAATCGEATTRVQVNASGAAWVSGARPDADELVVCLDTVVLARAEQYATDASLTRTLSTPTSSSSSAFALDAYSCSAAVAPPLDPGVWFECIDGFAQAIFEVVPTPTPDTDAVLVGVDTVVWLADAVDGDLLAGEAVSGGLVSVRPAEAGALVYSVGDETVDSGVVAVEVSLAATRAALGATAADVGLAATLEPEAAALLEDGTVTWRNQTAAVAVEMVAFELDLYAALANVSAQTLTVVGGNAREGDLLWLSDDDDTYYTLDANLQISVGRTALNGSTEVCLAAAELPAVRGACLPFEFVVVPDVYPQQTYVGGAPAVPEGMTWRWDDGGACGQELDTSFEGRWTACYRADAAAEWSAIEWIGMDVVPLPVPYPRVAISAHNTSIEFDGAEAGTQIAGGYIGCNGFYFAYGELSMAVSVVTTQFSGVLVSSATYGVGYMAVWTAVPGSVSDFVELPSANRVQMVAAIEVSPLRTLEGANQVLAMENGGWGWLIWWVSSSGAWDADDFLAGVVPAGEYECFQTPYDGVETRVPECDIVVDPAPVFSPTTAVAGLEVVVDFFDGGAEGDVVFMAADCSSPERALTSKGSLGKRALEDVVTSVLMSRAVVMQVCVAAAPGDSADDYVAVGEFELVDPPDWGPRRTVTRDTTVFKLANPRVGDEVYFSADGACNGSHAAGEAIVVDEVPFEITLADLLEPGEWTACYRVAGGDNDTVWQSLGDPLEVIPPPTFWPAVHVAGSWTRFTLADGALENDIVRFSYSNCSESDYDVSLGSNLRAWLPWWMDRVENLVVCFATGESGGDEASDFVELGAVRVLAPPEATPLRTYETAAQNVTVRGFNASASRIGFNYNGRCWHTDNDELLLAQGSTRLPADAAAGRWALCLQPDDGWYTDVRGESVTVEELPTVPAFGVADVNLAYPIDGAEPGDRFALGADCALAGQLVSDEGTFNASLPAGSYPVCIAAGTDDADWAVLPEPFLLINDTTFTPNVVYEGSYAEVYVATSADGFGWTQSGSSCDYAFDATGARTSTIELDPLMASGQYRMCVRRDDSGDWEFMGDSHNLTVLDAPLVQPCRALVGYETEMWLAAPARDLDLVAVVTSSRCAGAAEAKQVVRNGTITVAASASARVHYVCLASAESGGLEDSDFAVIPTTYETVHAPTVAPSRVALQASQRLDFGGVDEAGDRWYLTQDGACPDESNATWVDGQFLELGTWTLCFQACAAGPWHFVSGATVEVVAPPERALGCGVTELSTGFDVFSGGLDGDVLALVPWGANCSAAGHRTELPAPTTPTTITEAGEYQVCFATLESGGDDDHDFVPVPAGNVTMRPRLALDWPYVTLIEQPWVTVDGLSAAESEFGFSRSSTCSDEDVESVSSAEDSWRATFEAVHTYYYACQRPLGCADDTPWQPVDRDYARWPMPTPDVCSMFRGHAADVTFEINHITLWLGVLEGEDADCSVVTSWSVLEDRIVARDLVLDATSTLCISNRAAEDFGFSANMQVLEPPTLGVTVAVEGAAQLVAPAGDSELVYSWTCDGDGVEAAALAVPADTPGNTTLQLCAKPAGACGGVWTAIEGETVFVMPMPSYWPTVGVEDMSTPLDVSPPDGFVAVDCDPSTAVPASEAVAGSSTLCFASAESGGDSADDYAVMPPEFDQYAVWLLPERICQGAPNASRVQNGRAGDAAELEVAALGEHTLSYRPPDGRWTVVDGVTVSVGAVPTLAPTVVVEGSRQVQVVGGGAAPGDALVVGGVAYEIGEDGFASVAAVAADVAFVTAEMWAAGDLGCPVAGGLEVREAVTLEWEGCGHSALLCGLAEGDVVELAGQTLSATAEGECQLLQMGPAADGAMHTLWFTPAGDSERTDLGDVWVPARSETLAGVVTVLGAPLADVDVTLWAGDVALETVTTDAAGRYEFVGLVDGGCWEVSCAVSRETGLLSGIVGDFFAGGEECGDMDLSLDLPSGSLSTSGSWDGGLSDAHDCVGLCFWRGVLKEGVDDGVDFEVPSALAASTDAWHVGSGDWAVARTALTRLQGVDQLEAELVAAELYLANGAQLPAPWDVLYGELVRLARTAGLRGDGVRSLLAQLNGMASEGFAL